MSVTDRRRVLGPSTALPLVYEEVPETKEKIKDPELFIRCGLVGNASGSCYIETDNGDKVSVSVYGPHPIRSGFTIQARLRIECRIIQSFDIEGTTSGGMNKQEIDICDFIFTCIHPSIRLSQYPKSGIDIFISVIGKSKTNSSLISNAVNAASIAVLDAGIQLYDLVTCSSVSNTIVGVMAARNEITGYIQQQQQDDDQEENLKIALNRAGGIRITVNEFLIQRMVSICNINSDSGATYVKSQTQQNITVVDQNE